jgi:oxygen-independent coproporphyrinogen-3 oxidase
VLIERFGAPDEVTVECNPTSLDRERAARLRDIGVTRVSIGVQSLRENHLRYLGRLHDADGARRAIREAVSTGSLRVSADLMFGMPDQSASALIDDARELLDLGVEHVSAYALTIEPATRFGELARKGRLPRLPDDDVAGLYEALEAFFDERGWVHYEVSNYARPGAEARHNVAYWRGADYIGLGTGAVGCSLDGVGRATRYRTLHDVPAFLSAARGERAIAEEAEALDAETIVREGLMLGLRTSDGLDLASLSARSGLDPCEGREQAIARAVARGDLVRDGGVWKIPRTRWLLADDIVARLF